MNTVPAYEVTQVIETDGATYQSSTSTSSGAGGTSNTTVGLFFENIMPKFLSIMAKILSLINGEEVRN